MRQTVVVDTNVPVVANGKHERAGPECVAACISALIQARRKLLLLDDRGFILAEYRRHLAHRGQPGVGDAFYKWLWDNQANPARCRIVVINPIGESETDFAEYPADPELAAFDPSDRKYVAVASASGLEPDILNASDTDWWSFREALMRHGINVKFLCPELMQREEL